MTDEPLPCSECRADFGHRPDCSRRVVAVASEHRGLHALIPTSAAESDGAAFAGRPVIAPPRPKLRALDLTDAEPPLASTEIVDRVISALLAEDARARSCLPDPPAGWRWDASLDARSNGEAAQGEVRVRIAYRLVEDA